MTDICDETRRFFGSLVPVMEEFAQQRDLRIGDNTYDGAHQIGVHWRSPHNFSCSMGLVAQGPRGEEIHLGCGARPPSARKSKFTYIRSLGYFVPENNDRLIASLEEGKAWADELRDARNPDGSPSIAPILEAIRSEHGNQRSSAAHSLGLVGDERAVMPLVHALDDRNDLTCVYAFKALAELAGRGYAASVRSAAKARLLEVFQQQDHLRRVLAIDILGQLNDRSLLPVLRPLLTEKDARVRVAGILALGRLKDTASIPALLDVLKRVDGAPAGAVNTDARRIHGFRPIVTRQDIEEAFRVRASIDDEEERIAVATAFGLLSHPAMVPLLLSMLDRDRSEAVRKAAAEALGRLGTLQTIEPMMKLARTSSDSLRSEIDKAVRQIEKRSAAV
ncbi:MAG: HEAT repeat domain-containing protein [Capsulimonadaceae bacterium]